MNVITLTAAQFLALPTLRQPPPDAAILKWKCRVFDVWLYCERVWHEGEVLELVIREIVVEPGQKE